MNKTKKGVELMESQVLIACISFMGTVVGSIAGIMVSNKLINYRIEQLEIKVNKHNNLIERMYKVEQEVEVLREKAVVNNG